MTEIKLEIRKQQTEDPHFQGYADIIIGDSYKFHNIEINKDELGYYMKMPSYQSKKTDANNKNIQKNFFQPLNVEFSSILIHGIENAFNNLNNSFTLTVDHPLNITINSHPYESGVLKGFANLTFDNMINLSSVKILSEANDTWGITYPTKNSEPLFSILNDEFRETLENDIYLSLKSKEIVKETFPSVSKKDTSYGSETVPVLSKETSDVDMTMFEDIPVMLLLDEYRKDMRILEFVSNEYLNDRNIAIELMKINGFGLSYLCDEFKSDKEIVIKALESQGEALFYVDKSLKNDLDVVLTAITNNPLCVKYLPEESKKHYGTMDYVAYCAIQKNNKIVMDWLESGKYIDSELLNSEKFKNNYNHYLEKFMPNKSSKGSR